ncbi:MAG TPA: anthranilate synthase component I [Pirellulaceae bacterium]|jgi:anthranilate synthase component 1|nr:anthranilate synthase component I [Pirellulaceae bacterium]
MTYHPDFETFRELAGRYDLVPVYRRLVSDAWTPVSAFAQLDVGGPACLFESVIGGEKVGRYTFLAFDPYKEIRAWGRDVEIVEGDHVERRNVENPLEILRDEFRRHRAAPVPGVPPFTGGAVGYAGYDAIRYVERLPNPPEDDRALPDVDFAFYDRVIAFDNVNKTMLVVALGRSEERGRAEEADDEEALRDAYETACRRCDEVVDRLLRSSPTLACVDVDTSTFPTPNLVSNFRTQEAFESAVRKCVEYIRAGDIFQVVLSQRFDLERRVDAFTIYRTLRIVNPSPFMFFLRTAQATLVGSSPEIMCRVMDREVTVRPLAGTRPRGKTPEEDLRLERELLGDPKERAEHVMLVDLGRNDVGRVAKYGTVKLEDVMTVERYSHVMHLSSGVTGQLRDDMDAFDALLASLPAGTVSGAPKIRAMEIIDELEPNRRGPYAGAVGYVDFHGNMDTCIALRTLVVQGDKAYIQAGAGIVADSDPTAEYQETLNKARGLFKAVELAERGAAALERTA